MRVIKYPVNTGKQKVIEGDIHKRGFHMPRKHERDRAVGMVQADMRHIDVANNFGVSKLTITRLMSRRRKTGSSNDTT